MNRKLVGYPVLLILHPFTRSRRVRRLAGRVLAWTFLPMIPWRLIQ